VAINQYIDNNKCRKYSNFKYTNSSNLKPSLSWSNWSFLNLRICLQGRYLIWMLRTLELHVVEVERKY